MFSAIDAEDLQSVNLKGNLNKLKVFHSDPLDYHSIMIALKGCSALFYSFQPPPDHSTYDVSLSLSENEFSAVRSL